MQNMPQPQERKRIGEIATAFAATAKGMQRFADALQRATATMKVIAKALEREEHYLERHEWWKRGDGQPEYEVDLNDKEWWENGDEPDFFTAI